MESQGKSGNLKIFAQKVKESQGKKFQWKMKFLEAHLVFKIVFHKKLLGVSFLMPVCRVYYKYFDHIS